MVFVDVGEMAPPLLAELVADHAARRSDEQHGHQQIEQRHTMAPQQITPQIMPQPHEGDDEKRQGERKRLLIHGMMV